MKFILRSRRSPKGSGGLESFVAIRCHVTQWPATGARCGLKRLFLGKLPWDDWAWLSLGQVSRFPAATQHISNHFLNMLDVWKMPHYRATWLLGQRCHAPNDSQQQQQRPARCQPHMQLRRETETCEFNIHPPKKICWIQRTGWTSWRTLWIGRPICFSSSDSGYRSSWKQMGRTGVRPCKDRPPGPVGPR